MGETELTSELIEIGEQRMPYSVGLKHAERSKVGYPDFSWTWNRRTSWWEVKFYDNAPFDAPPLQRTICRRLAQAGFCHYIIYERRIIKATKEEERRVLIVHPNRLDTWMDCTDYTLGFDHVWVARYIHDLHKRI